jgi:hypothetical protein
MKNEGDKKEAFSAAPAKCSTNGAGTLREPRLPFGPGMVSVDTGTLPGQPIARRRFPLKSFELTSNHHQVT